MLNNANVALTSLSSAMAVALDQMSADGVFSDVPSNVKTSVESLISGLITPISSSIVADKVDFALNKFNQNFIQLLIKNYY